MNLWLPAKNMMDPSQSAFRRDIGSWIWAYKDNQLVYETGEVCRVKVAEFKLMNDTEVICQSREKGLGMMKWWQ